MLLTQKGIKSTTYAEDGQIAVRMVSETLKDHHRPRDENNSTRTRSRSSSQGPQPQYDMIFMDNTMPHMVKKNSLSIFFSFSLNELFLFVILRTE
jgi:CheY-like chemotaxis protein